MQCRDCDHAEESRQDAILKRDREPEGEQRDGREIEGRPRHGEDYRNPNAVDQPGNFIKRRSKMKPTFLSRSFR